MQLNQRCLRQLDTVRAAARDPEAAYVLRTRLRRFILAVLRLVAEDEGLGVPTLPGPITYPDNIARRSAAILDICRQVEHKTRSLCQRSEPLDHRWKVGWHAVEQDLEQLERLLRDGSAAPLPTEPRS